MNRKDLALVLKTTRYDDNKNIAECWTRENGTRSFYVRTGAQNSRRKILFKPAQWLEIQYIEKPRRLPVATSVSRLYLYRNLPGDLRKTAVIYFITDILRQTQKYQNPDPAFFDYTFKQIRLFDQTPFKPDFHLHFLIQLAKQSGISPFTSQNGTIFDNISAEKDKLSSFNGMEELDIKLMENFIRNGKTRSRDERKSLLNGWLHFFKYHFENFKTPEVIRIYNEIFE